MDATKGALSIYISNKTAHGLEGVRKEVYESTGIYMGSYRQVIDFLIEHYKKSA